MFVSLPVHTIPSAIASYLLPTSIPDILPGYATIDGDYIPQEEGEEALRTGMAVLVGGLLVGLG